MPDKSKPGPAPVYEPGFFSEFTPVSMEQWEKAAVKSLKGAPLEKKAYTKTYEGITLKPLYRPKDMEQIPHLGSLPGFAPFVRGVKPTGYLERPWLICQELSCPTPQEFNQAALHGLKRGQTALGLVLDKPTRQGLDPEQGVSDQIGQAGLSLACLDDAAQALKDIGPTTPLFANCGADPAPLAALLAAWARANNGDTSDLNGCLGGDPLGALAASGQIPLSLDDAYDCMASLTGWASAQAPGLRTVLVDASTYHDAGGSAVEELAFALATGVEYLRALLDRGLSVEQATGAVGFAFSIGGHFFMEIAKLRAARLIWQRAVEAFGGSESVQAMWIHARTSAFNQTVFDPYVNMLRNTTETFSALVGQVDSLHVRPFDQAIRPADEFSRRVSRNLQILLQKECHLTIPMDPAGGSWLVESLTDELAQKAWALFQQVEKAGGMAKALEQGLPQEQCAGVAAQRKGNLAKRKDVMVGTNQYADPAEKELEVPARDQAALAQARQEQVAAARKDADLSGLASSGAKMMDAAMAAFQAGASLGQVAASLGHGQSAGPEVKALDLHRAARPYEALRQNSKQHGAIKVFLANLGPVPQHKPRADFSAGFFNVGGFEVLNNQGFASPEEAARAALESKAPVVVICSSDKAYPEGVPPLTRAIKEKDPGVTVLLAGRPAPEQQAAYDQAGLDGAIYLGCDCLGLLTDLQNQKGVAK